VAYLDRVLQPGEKVLVRGRLHWFMFLAPITLLVVGAVIAVAGYIVFLQPAPAPHPKLALVAYGLGGLVALFGLFHLLGRFMTRATTEFAVTDHRVVVKRGFIARHTIEMNLDKVESVDVDQSVLGRIFNFGAVTIHGVGARWDPIGGIAEPLRFRNAITTRSPVAA